MKVCDITMAKGPCLEILSNDFRRKTYGIKCSIKMNLFCSSLGFKHFFANSLNDENFCSVLQTSFYVRRAVISIGPRK